MTPLNSREAREFIKSKGIPMCKSSLYNLTSQRGIIFHRAGNRLIFYEEELEVWCNKQIVTPSQIISNAKMCIVESALNKSSFNH